MRQSTNARAIRIIRRIYYLQFSILQSPPIDQLLFTLRVTPVTPDLPSYSHFPMPPITSWSQSTPPAHLSMPAACSCQLNRVWPGSQSRSRHITNKPLQLNLRPLPPWPLIDPSSPSLHQNSSNLNHTIQSNDVRHIHTSRS